MSMLMIIIVSGESLGKAIGKWERAGSLIIGLFGFATGTVRTGLPLTKYYKAMVTILGKS